MTEERFNAGNFSARVLRCNTAIVGTGAAGYNAADRLWQYGRQDILLITEKRTAGTSRNTGSDKQTYYKLTLSGGDPDSVREMAETLFDGQCVDGDIALCEAALSTQGFLKLAELGVPFPRNRYGEYIGYKTDHDPRRRATSVGPYTSKQMTEKLEAAVTAKGVPILDNTQVIKIVSDGERVLGLLCLNTKAQSAEDRYLLVRCKNVVYATGGPAGIYADSVYPASQFGATGLALEAGVKGKNLTEWQYGLASTRPRWNVSGTYMQVLPRIYSAEPDGSDPREFLMDFFTTPGEMLSKLFLKGYQWPFDVRKVASGSSIIDILVYLESCKGRKVYLDYRTNPVNGNFRFEELDAEALDYLTRAGACFGTPIERLLHMNAPAVDFYRDKGVDLAAEPLEISLCAQHNNGGLDIDCWWQTNLKGFFAVGEVAASHGVYRPGGSALNAGQVGSTRAAQYIAARRGGAPEHEDAFHREAARALTEMGNLAQQAFTEHDPAIYRLRNEAGRRMSACGAAIRNSEAIAAYIAEIRARLENLPAYATISESKDLAWLYRYRDTLISQQTYLSAMVDYLRQGGKSRGSALYTDPSGRKPFAQLPDTFTFTVDDGSRGDLVQEASWKGGECTFRFRKVRPIPEDDDFFENVWRSYRETGNIY